VTITEAASERHDGCDLELRWGDDRDPLEDPVDEVGKLAVLQLLRKELFDVLVPSPEVRHRLVAWGDDRCPSIEESPHTLTPVLHIEVEAPPADAR